jgi:hypothetical protein
MSLNSSPHFPSVGGYVLKLHRDAMPQHGQLCGRVVHIATGDCADFANAEQLIDWLLQHAAQQLPPTVARDSPPPPT